MVVRGDKELVDVTVKSEATPVVAPIAPETDIVQMTVAATREGAVLTHVKLESGVGVSYATKVSRPERIWDPLALTKMEKTLEVTTGVVENVKVCPPLTVVKSEIVAVAVAAKSTAIPVVAPEEPETEIVQSMIRPTREGLVLVQARLDAIVGVP
jgi:hypothetical protein